MHQLITYACFYTPIIYMHNIQLADLAHKTLLYSHLFLYTEYSSIGQLIYIHNTFAHQPIFIILRLYTLDHFAYTFAYLNLLGSLLLETRVLSLLFMVPLMT